MHLHQVLTGAVNPGDSCYSVGSVNDIPFTVCILYVDVHLTRLATKLASYIQYSYLHNIEMFAILVDSVRNTTRITYGYSCVISHA